MTTIQKCYEQDIQDEKQIRQRMIKAMKSGAQKITDKESRNILLKMERRNVTKRNADSWQNENVVQTKYGIGAVREVKRSNGKFAKTCEIQQKIQKLWDKKRNNASGNYICKLEENMTAEIGKGKYYKW